MRFFAIGKKINKKSCIQKLDLPSLDDSKEFGGNDYERESGAEGREKDRKRGQVMEMTRQNQTRVK